MVRKKLLLVIVGGVFSVLLVGSVVQAATKSPAPGSTLGQRIAQRKSEQNIKLEERDAKRLTDRCGKAQLKVGGMQQTLSETVNIRKKKYEAISAKLWVAIGRHKLAQQDTFVLEKQHTTLNNQISKFSRLTDEYLQSLDDIVVMNCQADAVGFKAVLETSRVYLTQIRDHSEAIRAHVIDNVKPELTNLAQKL